jgi:hypothetical protein
MNCFIVRFPVFACTANELSRPEFERNFGQHALARFRSTTQNYGELVVYDRTIKKATPPRREIVGTFFTVRRNRMAAHNSDNQSI